MSEYVLAAILGVVEGITEFLPISSTAHLRIAQHFLGISLDDEFWKLFAIFIQLGAILAVAVLLRARLSSFFRDALSPDFYRQGLAKIAAHPIFLIVVAFLATAIPAFLFKKVIGDNLESITVMAAAMAVGGVLMIVIDAYASNGRTDSLEGMRWPQALAIGICQVFSAIFPGTSRSMSTIAGGELVGLNRATAVEFSFLVSIPIMIVATLYDLLKYLKAAPAGLDAHQTGLLAVGFLLSFVVGYAVVAWFLGYVRRRGFFLFGLYRIALGALLFFLK
jgi:undecaprenyl-diphosphatase